MASEQHSIAIKILGRDYQIACQPSEEEALRHAATFLNGQMEQIKKHGSTLSFEKVAVMTALNISHELLQHSQEASNTESDAKDFLQHLEKKIEAALQSSRQYEI